MKAVAAPAQVPPLFRATVGVAAIGEVGSEPFVIRDAAATFGAEARLANVGCSAHLVEILSGRAMPTEYLVLACHGDHRGLLLPADLDSEVAAAQPFAGDLLTPELTRKHTNLSDTVVISTGCATGSQELADAFLSCGACAYIAPADYPDGDAAVMFVIALLYAAISRGVPLPAAQDFAQGLGTEVAGFRLFRRGVL